MLGHRSIVLKLLLLLALTAMPALHALAQEYAYAPVTGKLTSNFGWRTDPMHGGRRFHGGVDLAAPMGMPIYAPQAGVVVYSGYYGGYGNVVVLHHGNSLYTLYGHASRRLVNTGDSVYRGQAIAQVGSTGRSTGPHLHFEVHYNRQYVDPLVYLSYLQRQNPGLQNAGTAVPHSASASPARQVAYQSRRRPASRKKGRTVQVVNGTSVSNVQF